MKDFKDIPWDFMPPEQHFNSPGDLKRTILFYQSTRLEKWQKNPQYLSRLGKFEAIENIDHSFTLWPCAVDYGFLFRGQQAFFKECKPTLYRSTLSKDELFLERLRLTEFELLARQYPAVEFFNRHNFTIDYLGLAQHYLLKTEVLDLTSDIDVAMFFAMCDFDLDNDCYVPKTEEKEYIGYIYVYPLAQNLLSGNSLTISFNRVNPIGLQPFKRPGEQCGYALHMRSEDTFKSSIYSFSYTKKDSEYILAYFKENRQLFFGDDFSSRVKQIIDSKTLSISALHLAASRWSKIIYDRKRSTHFCQTRMNDLGVHFKDNPMPWDLSIEERQLRYDTFEKEDKQEILGKIIIFRTVSAEGELSYRTVEHFSHSLIYEMYIGGCPSLPGYDSEFSLTYDDKNQMSIIGYNYGREQTVPNPKTGKVDKWDSLPWDEYSKVTIEDYMNPNR